MKKGIFAVLLITFVYCILNLLVVHETLIQIEHKEPLNIIAQNSTSIHTEQTEHGYLTDIVLPSKIFYNHAHIEIKSDIQQNAVIKFSGPKVKYKDTYKKYPIDYRNAHVNNEEILSKVKTFSFLKPFSYSVDDLTSTTVDFEYKTDFVLRNMSLIHFIIGIVIFIVNIVTFLYNNKIIRNIFSYYLHYFNSKDLLLLVINSYKNIRKEYKICFWVNFIVLNLVYLYLNMNFLHGNHDWPYIYSISSIPGWYSTIGRFSIPMVSILTEFKYLPFVNNCLAFTFLSLTPLFLIKYWKLPVTKFNIFAVSALLFLHPQLLAVFYFLHLSYAYFLVPLLLVIGLILSEKKNYKISILSIMILVFAIGDYNVCINTLAVIFLGKMLIEYANGNSFIALFKKYFRTICIILLSCLIYFLIIQYLKYVGAVIEFYNISLLPADKILPRTVNIFIISFKQFYMTYPFVDLRYLIVLSLLFVPMLMLIFFEVMNKKNIVYLLGTLFIFIVLVFSSKIVYCVTATDVSLYCYVYYFSIPFVYTVVIAYILNSQKLWSKNLLFLLLIPICYMSILRDFEYQKYWKIGLDGEKQFISRVAERIEEQDEFKYDKKYKLLLIGYYQSFNASLLSKTYLNNINKMSLVVGPIIPGWGMESMHYFMPRTQFIYSSSDMLITCNTSKADIKTAFKGIPKEKIMNLKPWPNKNSVLVYEGTIIVCWQEKDLEYVKKALEEKE